MTEVRRKRPTLAEMVGLHMTGLNEFRDSPDWAPSLPPDRHVFDVPQKEHPPLSFGPTSVAALAMCCFNQQIQFGMFRPSRLYIPSHLGLIFNVDDVRIGMNSELGPQGVQAYMFGEDMPDPGIEFDTAQIGQVITVVVTNNTSTPQTFQATMVGGRGGKGPPAPRLSVRDPIRLCDCCGAPPKRGHASDACYYCQRKR